MDSIHLPDRDWQRETNWCNPPWALLDDLTANLRQSCAGATVIAPKWPRFRWFAHLSEMASEVVEMPPFKNLFSPYRRVGHGKRYLSSITSKIILSVTQYKKY